MKQTDTGLRGALLDAAEAVVARQGVANLTFDAVAAEAGMSKGGLLASLSEQGPAGRGAGRAGCGELARLLDGIIRKSAGGPRADDARAVEPLPF